MHACSVTASSGKCDVTAVIVGHCAHEVPAVVEAEAARLATGKVSGPLTVVTESGSYVVLKPSEDAWLVGGEAWRLLGSQIIAQTRALGHASVLVAIDGNKADVTALVEGVVLGDYQFTLCRSGKAAKRTRVTVRVPGQKKTVATGLATAESQNIAREFGDLPGNMLNPSTFIQRARKVLTGCGLRISVVQGIPALRTAGFPGLIAVGQAGSAPPALLEISYKPKKVKKGGKKLALVGKGITFDTGGISLKPGANMGEMKVDMGGAAAVLGAIRMIANEKPSVPVTAYIALAENMPSSKAQRPGDIYKARNGKWIHVDNTDAEGRLVLSDVLTYACEQGATHMVDAATLTGACLVALGTSIAGVMGRAGDQEWVEQVRSSGQSRGEEFWQLPLYGEYTKLLDYPHADLNNIGGRFGGTITAGLFLSEFVTDKVQWAHCDIAGPAMRFDGWRYYGKGSTAFAARSFAALAKQL
ncbi:MAG: leucyl aminopeptidase family protein [Planctomycetota bacterium]|jgi:leucyl aminopeptidase|nr:leucyl aminopeptidase family protein [Planctomycetota bacterium]